MRLSAKVAAIEFDGDVVRVAVVKTGRRLPTVLELHEARAVYDEPEERFEALATAAREAAKAVKARTGAYVLSTTSLYAVVRAITIPFRGQRKVAAAVAFELEPYLAFPIEDLIVDYTTVREIEGKTEVLAVGMRREPLEEQLAVLDAAGIDVQGIGIDAAGLTQLWVETQKSLKGLNAVLHVRETGSVLAILSGPNLAFFRHMSLTAHQLRENPAAAARDVQNSVRAFLARWEGEDTLAGLTVSGAGLAEHERNLFGGGVPGYERLMERARRQALVRMLWQAQEYGANAVWNVRLETSTIQGKREGQSGGVEVLAYGTAMKVRGQ